MARPGFEPETSRSGSGRSTMREVGWGWMESGVGDGGTLNFICYIVWVPASSVYLKKYTVCHPYKKKKKKKKISGISAVPKQTDILLVVFL